MLISELPIVLLRSLLITLLIEITIAFILKYRKMDLLMVLLVNIMTNPLLNSLVVCVDYYYGNSYRTITLIIMEILVVFIEGLIYNKSVSNKKINGYLLSLILNASSFLFGLIINSIIY